MLAGCLCLSVCLPCLYVVCTWLTARRGPVAVCLPLSVLSVCSMSLACSRKRPSCLLNSSTCLSSCLSGCISVFLSVCLSVFQPVCLCVVSMWYVLVLQDEEAQLLAQQHSAVYLSVCLVFIRVVCACLTGGRGLFRLPALVPV